MNQVQMAQKRITKSQGDTLIKSKLIKEIWTLMIKSRKSSTLLEDILIENLIEDLM